MLKFWEFGTIPLEILIALAVVLVLELGVVLALREILKELEKLFK